MAVCLLSLFFLVTALTSCKSCKPCFTLCIPQTSGSAELCPVQCDETVSVDLVSLQVSALRLTVQATNESCEAEYELVLASQETRISTDPEKTSGRATAVKMEHLVNIRCANGMRFRAEITINAKVSTSTNNSHDYPISLERVCSSVPANNRPADSSDSTSLSGRDLLVVVICSALGGVMILIIVLLTAIYLRKQTVSPESGSEVAEKLGRRVTMTFPMATAHDTNEEIQETAFYRPLSIGSAIIPHELEFPYDQVKILETIGQTTFGSLSQAEATDLLEGQTYTSVLVRMLREDVDGEVTRGFLKQIEKMASLVHDNVVQLLGVCSREVQPCMIFEYPDGGNLNDILQSADPERQNPPTENLSQTDLLGLALQVANAMAYLERRRFVHRDVATRNCLLTKNHQIKLLPFGVIRPQDSKSYYKVGHQTMLPVRWLPHNTIIQGRFNTQTDVWSFGVFLWELFSYGKQPFEGLTNEEVVKSLREGAQLECPKACPQDVYDLMLQCWLERPTSRPMFLTLHAAIRLMQL